MGTVGHKDVGMVVSLEMFQSYQEVVLKDKVSFMLGMG